MKMPDPLIIGFPAMGSPLVLGTVSGHQLDDDLIIGHTVIFETQSGRAEFAVNVSYVPENPKRQRLVSILVPKSELPDDLWESEGFEKAAGKTPEPVKQEEWPF